MQRAAASLNETDVGTWAACSSTVRLRLPQTSLAHHYSLEGRAHSENP